MKHDESKQIESVKKEENHGRRGSRRSRRARHIMKHRLEYDLEQLQNGTDPNHVAQDIINFVENKPEPFGSGGIIKTIRRIPPDDAHKMYILCATYYYKMESYINTPNINEMYKKNHYFRDLPRDSEMKSAIALHEDLEQHLQIINFPIYHRKDVWTQYKKYYAINQSIYKMIITKKCDVFHLNNVKQKIKNEITVSNMVDITYLQLYPKLSEELEMMIGAMGSFNIENEAQFNDILKRLQQQTGLINEELQLLKYVMNKYKYYQPMYDSFSISFKSFCKEEWNAKDDERRLWEIYGVHKVFRNHNNPSMNYNIFDFCDEYLKINYPEKLQIYLLINKTIDIHPLYVINDDMEQIMDYVMGISYVVHYITNQPNDGVDNVNIIIIPKSIQSSMDKTSFYERDIPDLSTLHQCTEIAIQNNDRERIYNQIKTIYDREKTVENHSITIVVDRRGNDGNDTVYFYSTPNCDPFEALFRNYCLSFTFHLDNNKVICYLWSAIYQKVRFFPDMMVSIIPKLFNKRLFNGNQFKRIQLIYNHSFKNGFGVNLKDDEFNDLYKQMTQYTHVCNNYDRNWIHKGGIEIMEKEWTESKEECNSESPLNECLHINNMIQMLKVHRNSHQLIDSKILNDLQLNYDHIIRCHGLFTNKNNRLQITTFITEQMNDGKHCEHGNKCPFMLEHINTKKESYRHEGGMDSLFDYLEQNGMNKYQSSKLSLWFGNEEYDSDAITDDLEDNTYQSNIHQQLQSDPNKQQYIKLAKQHMNISKVNDNNIDSLHEFLKYNGIEENIINTLTNWCMDNEYDTDCIADDVSDAMEQSNIFENASQPQYKHAFNLTKIHLSEMTESDGDDDGDIIAKRTFNSIHTYLLHSGEELYRTKNHLINARLRFATQVQIHNEDDDDINSRKEIYQIDFGQTVLKWLSYGEEPTFNKFRDEIIFNPLSTIDETNYMMYENECKLLCISVKSIDIELQEMMSLKLYTDTTKYQSALRRAFWLNIDQQQKRNFYQWAITLYRTFQRYSKPPHSTKLYHGLNAVFVVESAIPQYNGIFSTSMSFNVAHQFSDGTGVLWEIEASYSNPFKLVVGISTEWFSSFKNEAEFVVFNSLIPIDNVRNFTDTVLQQIDILLKQLQVLKKQIVDKRSFYKNIGLGIKFKMPKKWKKYIKEHINHDILYSKTVFDGYCVLHRLVNELGLWNDIPFGRVLMKHHTVDIQSSFGFGTLRMGLTEDDDFKDDFKECEYIVNMNTNKIFKYNDDIIIRNRNKMFRVYVRNNKLFGHNEFMVLSIHNASEFNDIESECGWTQRLKIESGIINLAGVGELAVNTKDIINARYIIKGSYFNENDEKEHVLLNDLEYNFADLESFTFKVTNDSILIPRKYHIYVSPTKYKEFHLMKHSNLVNKSALKIMNTHSINIEKEIDVTLWNRESKIGGSLQIYSAKTLIINENGCINASQCGYCNGIGIGRGTQFETDDEKTLYYGGGSYGEFGEYLSGKTYGSKTLDILHYGSGCSAQPTTDGHERGGGIIELIADKVINYGKILCNGYKDIKEEEMEFGCGGSGGSIKIKCKTFINKGIMEAKGAKGNNYGLFTFLFKIGYSGYGRIAIECEEYENNGTICPQPCIKFTKFVDINSSLHFTEIDCHDEEKKDDTLSMDSFIEHCRMLFLVKESKAFDTFKSWYLEEEYDSDAMRCDLEDQDTSNMIRLFNILGVEFTDDLLGILYVEAIDKDICVESYFEALQTESGFESFKTWFWMEEYDSDAIIYDIEEENQSNLVQVSRILLKDLAALEMDSFLGMIKIRFDLLKSCEFDAFVSWCSIEEFDSDAIQYDIEEENQSNVHHILDTKLNGNKSTVADETKSDTDDEDDTKQNEIDHKLTFDSFVSKIQMQFDFLNIKFESDGFGSWFLSEEYDSDAIQYDIDDKEQSNLHNIFQNTLAQEPDTFYEIQTNQNSFYHIFHDPKQQSIYQYKIEQCLVINSKLDVTKWRQNDNGVLQIQCNEELIIERTGYIDADCCGYSFGFGIGKGQTVDGHYGGGGYGSFGHSDPIESVAFGGALYGNKKLDILHRGSPSGCINEKCALGLERGGGVIEFIAQRIINYGIISCNGFKINEEGHMMCYGGSGGSIKFKCKQFVNKGVVMARGSTMNKAENIGAGGYGRICIQCEEFINEGTFYPIPYVEYTKYYMDRVDFTPIADRDETQNVEKEEEEWIGDDEMKLNQNNFYQMFYDSESLFKYELESLIINSELKIIPWSDNKNGGVLQIYCRETLTIEKTGHIMGDSVGYYYPFGIGRGHQMVGTNKGGNKQMYYSGGGYGTMGDSVKHLLIVGGSIYGTKELNVLFMGSSSGYNDDSESISGGGIIELVSETIVNNGLITCRGLKYGSSGGSIKFRCKRFINNGIINAFGAIKNNDLKITGGGDGRIAIYCEEYMNDGSIEPKPFIENKYYIYNDDVIHFRFSEINKDHLCNENAVRLVDVVHMNKHMFADGKFSDDYFVEDYYDYRKGGENPYITQSNDKCCVLL